MTKNKEPESVVNKERDKERLLANLETLRANLSCDDSIPKHYSDWLEIAIEYIANVKD